MTAIITTFHLENAWQEYMLGLQALQVAPSFVHIRDAPFDEI
jgi:hypothetical protein